MNRKILISVGGFLLLVVAGFVIFKIMTNKKVEKSQIRDFIAVKYVNTQAAEYKDYNAQISATGRVVSDKNIDIYSEVNGIMSLDYDRFKVGNSFKKGDVMIKLNDEESRLTYLAQKSEFLSLLTSIISDIKIDYSGAFDKWNKYISDYSIEKNLKDLPAVSNDKEKFFLASRKIFQTYYNLKNLESRLDKYIITAPVNGTVIESLVDPGTLVRVNQKLGRFATSGNYEIEFTVSLDYAGLIRVGTPFTASSDDGKYQYSGRRIKLSNRAVRHVPLKRDEKDQADVWQQQHRLRLCTRFRYYLRTTRGDSCTHCPTPRKVWHHGFCRGLHNRQMFPKGYHNSLPDCIQSQ